MIFNKLSAALLLALPVLAMAPAHAQHNPKLFSPLPQAMGSAAPAGPAEKHVVRQKAVNIHFSNIDQRAAATIKRIDVDLFDGSTLTLSLLRVEERGPRNYTWYGDAKGSPGSSAIFTVVDGYLTGSVTLIDGKSGLPEVYEIKADASGVHKMRQIDTSKLPADHDNDVRQHPRPAPGSAPRVNTAVPAATASGAYLTNVGGTLYYRKVDTIVLYSQQVAAATGAAIGSQVQASIDSANATFASNGVNTRLRLVYSAVAAFNENGSADAALNYLRTPTVNALRTNYGADFVSILAENELQVPGGTLCGQADGIQAGAGFANTVVKRSCATSLSTFTHELGHIYGARHQAAADPTNTPYAYGHGYVNLSKRWYTVMATQSSCGSTPGCVRLPYFSSPGFIYGGDPIGTAGGADNARVMAENAVRMASLSASTSPQETGIFGGNRASYTITMTGAAPQQTFNVTPAGGAALRFDSLDNARLQFADTMVALDLEGNAGKIYRLYQAAFNRVPDAPGLGYWIFQSDNGAALNQIALGFMGSAEFTSMYGTNPSNADFLTKVYYNVLHRAPDAGGYAYWLNALNSGISRQDVLVSISESGENKANTAAAVSQGIRYTRYGALAAPVTVSPFGR